MNKIKNWLWTTTLGGYYFELLLWIDTKRSKEKYLTQKEIAQIVRQYSLLDKGVKEVKRNINKLVTSTTAEEYDKVLSNIENLLKYSEKDPNSQEAIFADMLRSTKISKIKDIETHIDRVKMIEGRIKDYKELQEHVVKRKLMRQIRQAKKENDIDLTEQLETEWRDKYGNRHQRR